MLCFDPSTAMLCSILDLIKHICQGQHINIQKALSHMLTERVYENILTIYLSVYLDSRITLGVDDTQINVNRSILVVSESIL